MKSLHEDHRQYVCVVAQLSLIYKILTQCEPDKPEYTYKETKKLRYTTHSPRIRRVYGGNS